MYCFPLHLLHHVHVPDWRYILQTNDQKRHLLRFWVDTDANDRPIAPTFAPRSSVQDLGGFRYTPGTKLRLPLVPPSRPNALE